MSTANVDNLVSLGSEFARIHDDWLRMRDCEARDELLDRLNSLAEVIRLAPASGPADIVVKARNLLWAFGLTHAGVPGADEDPARHELAAFVSQLDGALA